MIVYNAFMIKINDDKLWNNSSSKDWEDVLDVFRSFIGQLPIELCKDAIVVAFNEVLLEFPNELY